VLEVHHLELRQLRQMLWDRACERVPVEADRLQELDVSDAIRNGPIQIVARKAHRGDLRGPRGVVITCHTEPGAVVVSHSPAIFLRPAVAIGAFVKIHESITLDIRAREGEESEESGGREYTCA